MASSGSVDFSVSRDDIIKLAYQQVGLLRIGETPSAEKLNTGANWLNLIVKQWQGTADFAPGLKVWSRKRAYLFLQKNTGSYALGPSGTHWTGSYSSTTISATEAAAQTVLSVTSSTGMSNADNIGIELDDGTLHWTTISSSGVGTVTVASGLASQASSGSRVFWYTTKARRPIRILTAVLRDSDGKDTPLDVMNLEKYERISDKSADGEPCSIFYEAQLTDGVLYTDVQPSDVTKVIRCVFLSNIEDFDSATDTPDYPQEYYLSLVMELSKYLAPIYGREFTQTMMDNRNNAVAIAKNLNPEEVDVYFEPGRD